jgi:hypothetical protein
MPDSKTKIEVTGKSLRIPIYVFSSGKTRLTISCADSKHSFKVGTSPAQPQKLRDRLEELFVELVEK